MRYPDADDFAIIDAATPTDAKSDANGNLNSDKNPRSDTLQGNTFIPSTNHTPAALSSTSTPTADASGPFAEKTKRLDVDTDDDDDDGGKEHHNHGLSESDVDADDEAVMAVLCPDMTSVVMVVVEVAAIVAAVDVVVVVIIIIIIIAIRVTVVGVVRREMQTWTNNNISCLALTSWCWASKSSN